MPTYSRRRSSCRLPSSRLTWCGRTPSSQPMMNTYGNSRPLEACRVIIRTWLPPSSLSLRESSASCAARSAVEAPRGPPSNHCASSSRLPRRRWYTDSSLHELRRSETSPDSFTSLRTRSPELSLGISARRSRRMSVKRLRPLAARGGNCESAPIASAACAIGRSFSEASSASLARVPAPTSRLGDCTARMNAVSSSGFTSRRSQDSVSLTSCRSRNAVPPVMWYGARTSCSAFSSGRDWKLPRNRMQKSLHGIFLDVARNEISAATFSASCSLLRHSHTRMRSPSAWSLHSFFRCSCGLLAISALAARSTRLEQR